METQRLAEFICSAKYEDLDEKTLNNAKMAVLDALGAAFAGSKEPACFIQAKACPNKSNMLTNKR